MERAGTRVMPGGSPPQVKPDTPTCYPGSDRNHRNPALLATVSMRPMSGRVNGKRGGRRRLLNPGLQLLSALTPKYFRNETIYRPDTCETSSYDGMPGAEDATRPDRFGFM